MSADFESRLKHRSAPDTTHNQERADRDLKIEIVLKITYKPLKCKVDSTFENKNNVNSKLKAGRERVRHVNRDLR